MTERRGDVSTVVTRAWLAALGTGVAATWLIVILGSGVFADLARDYYNDLPLHPYLHLADAGRLYLALPVVTLGAVALLLWPGIFIALCLRRGVRWTVLLPCSFAYSFLSLVVVTSLFKLLSGWAVDHRSFLWCVGVATAGAGSALAYRVLRGERLPLPHDGEDRRRLAWSMSILVVFLVSTIPMIVWQDTNQDGLELIRLGSSLSTNLLPRFPTPPGVRSLATGMLPMPFPVQWFTAVFGVPEVSARLPLLLYLPILFCLLLELIEWDSPRRLGRGEEAALSLGVFTYGIALGFNAGYDAYVADFSLAGAETLTVICILAAICALWRNDGRYFVLFGVLAFLCRPTGILLLGLAGVATVVTRKDHRWAWLRRIAMAIAACVVIAIVYDRLFIPSVASVNVASVPGAGLLERYRFLRFDDFARFGWVAFPVGVLPFVSLLAFKWQDAYARFIAVIALTYFAAFYFPAFTALHHFIPAMVLPLVVFWRLWLTEGFRTDVLRRVPRPLAVVFLVGLSALWMSLPRHSEVNRTVRTIAQTIELGIPESTGNDGAPSIGPGLALTELFPIFKWPLDASREFVVAGGLLYHYARQPERADVPPIYVVQRSGTAPPPGFTQAVDDGAFSVHVRDLELWHRDRDSPPPADFRSRLYDIPLSTLFAFRGIREGNYTIDVRRAVKYVVDYVRGIL